MTFATRFAGFHAELKRQGLDLHDMRGERHLELRFVAAPDGDRERRDEAAGAAVTRWLERAGGRTYVVPRTTAPSRLRYFLDGSQRTLPGYFSSVVPIIASVNAAGVLMRDDAGNPRVLPRTLRFRHAWLVPRRSPDDTVRRFIECAEARGHDVVDPLERLSDEQYLRALDDYARMEELAFGKARELRADLEEQLLHDWVGATAGTADDGWIVVDGALRVSAPRAVGLVKSFTRQYLTGDEAAALFRLPPGHRTAAFQVEDKWRLQPRTLWYLRFWDAAGRDPRHALVRVEAAADVTDPAQVDELSAWLMAERIPRATADERWATLLYPVHYLEQILKRYVEAETRGWPSPR